MRKLNYGDNGTGWRHVGSFVGRLGGRSAGLCVPHVVFASEEGQVGSLRRVRKAGSYSGREIGARVGVSVGRHYGSDKERLP